MGGSVPALLSHGVLVMRCGMISVQKGYESRKSCFVDSSPRDHNDARTCARASPGCSAKPGDRLSTEDVEITVGRHLANVDSCHQLRRSASISKGVILGARV